MKPRTLHVVSSVSSIGGHSRVLTKWVQRDSTSVHSIVMTRQRAEVPKFLQETWERSQTTLIQLRAEEAVETRASQLRSLSADYDRVILHTNPDDAVPVVAYALPGGPPVAMFNHAHFNFSLGSTVSDIIINTLPYYQGVSRRYRYPRATCLLTGAPGIVPIDGDHIDRRAAKKNLGLPEDEPVVMTMANEDYFRPLDGYNFFGTMKKLAERRPDLHLIFVGVSEHSPLVPEQLRRNERVRLVGPVVAPVPYYRAADLCLESFPMPSFGSLVESVTYGEAFPVPMYGKGENILLDVPLEPVLKYEHRPETEDDYVTYICRLLESPSATREKAAVLRKSIVALDRTFVDQFELIFTKQIDALRHAPREIPAAKCCTEEDSPIMRRFAEPDLCRQINHLLPVGRATLAHPPGAARRGYEGRIT